MAGPDRLQALTAGAQFDICSETADAAKRSPRNAARSHVYHAAVPGGTVPLFKVLLTNVCVNDCAYCANQSGRDTPRSSFLPEELARLFMEMYQRRRVKGLFLSSGVADNPSRTQESMIKVVEILRHRYTFDGYIHLKILPGAPADAVEAGCRLATRVSLNMEAPSAHHMARLSSRKNLHRDIVERMRWVKETREANQGMVPSGQTTQFVVGAAGESDREILQTTAALYSEMDLRRVYFSAFRPVSRSPLEGVGAAPPVREHRLYQADWLLRVYRFPMREVELALGQKGNLSRGVDPKLAIAQHQPWLFPVDINTAEYGLLLRIPGIGPVSASRIIEARRDHSVCSVAQLRKMGVATKRALPYIWFQGMLPTEKQGSFLTGLDEETTESGPSLVECLR